jgi:transposase-like protein
MQKPWRRALASRLALLPIGVNGDGRRGVRLVISDTYEGLKGANAKVLGASWLRCRVHFRCNAQAHANKQSRKPATLRFLRLPLPPRL